MFNVWNFIQFQALWLVTVLSAAAGAPVYAWLTASLLWAVHLKQVHRPANEAVLLASLGVLGWGWETVVTATGWLRYGDGFGWLAPAWLGLLWANFATTLNHSLGWLQGRPWLAGACGAVGGPLAFFAGAKLDGVTFTEPVAGLALLAVGWALLAPASLAFAGKIHDTRFPALADNR